MSTGAIEGTKVASVEASIADGTETIPPTISTTADIAGAGNSTSNIAKLAVPSGKRKIRGEFYSFEQIGYVDLNNAKGTVETQNYLGIKGSPGEGKSISVRQPFLYNWPKKGEKTTAHLTDIYAQYLDTKLATIGNVSVLGLGRAYLPTGESSRFVTKTKGSLYGVLIATYSVGKVDYNYNLVAQWFNQSQNGYTNSKGKYTGTQDYLYFQYPEAVWNISDTVSLSQSFGTSGVYYRPIAVTGMKRDTDFNSTTTFTWGPAPQFNLSVGISDDFSLERPKHSFQLFRGDELSYFLILASNI
jgi:hypothetical protein